MTVLRLQQEFCNEKKLVGLRNILWALNQKLLTGTWNFLSRGGGEVQNSKELQNSKAPTEKSFHPERSSGIKPRMVESILPGRAHEDYDSVSAPPSGFWYFAHCEIANLGILQICTMRQNEHQNSR